MNSGITDLHVGTKYSFLKIHNSNFHAALSFELGLPTGRVDGNLSDGFLEYEPSVILARDFPRLRNLQVFAQTGVGFVQRQKHHADPSDDEPAAHEWNWTGGFFLPLPHVVATTEFAWHTNRWNHGGGQNEVYLTPGAVWKLPGHWECGVGVSFGLTSDAHKVGVALKLTREFQTRGEKESE